MLDEESCYLGAMSHVNMTLDVVVFSLQFVYTHRTAVYFYLRIIPACTSRPRPLVSTIGHILKCMTQDCCHHRGVMFWKAT